MFSTERKINQPEIDLLWDAAQIDETAKIEVYKLMAECSTSMQDDIIELFLQKIDKNLKPEATEERDVTFVQQLGKNSYQKSQARQTAVELLWSIAIMERPGYQAAIIKQARKHVVDLLRN